MYLKLAAFFLFLFSGIPASAAVPEQVYAAYREFTRFVAANKPAAIARMINYPLERKNPLPDIRNAQEFLQLYPSVIDDSFRLLLAAYDDSVVFEHNGYYGLVGGDFAGDVWMTEDEKIETIRTSKTEGKKADSLTREIQKIFHPSVSRWKENIHTAKTGKLKIRVDLTEADSFRYTAWSNNRLYSEPPDIVLYSREQVFQGSMGGVRYIFRNKGWVYMVDRVDICSDAYRCGLFLRLLRNCHTPDIYDCSEKKVFKLKEIK